MTGRTLILRNSSSSKERVQGHPRGPGGLPHGGSSWALLIGFSLLVAGAMSAQTPARLIFTKEFPHSNPEYVNISVDRTGRLEYKEKADDKPITAILTASQTEKAFSLAEQVGWFKTPIESGLKVANTGKKTFRYEPESGAPSEVVFNYSAIVPAQQLLRWFEMVSSTEQAWVDLDRTVHFDHLGVNDSLAEVEALWLRKELMAPDQFLPLLKRIIKQESIMHMARDRAARLKDEIDAYLAGEKPPVEAGH